MKIDYDLLDGGRRHIQITDELNDAELVFNGVEYVPKPMPPASGLPRSLRWQDVEVGATVEFLAGLPRVVVAVDSADNVFARDLHTGRVKALTLDRGKLDRWQLVAPAPPLFERLTPGACVRLANGELRYIGYVDLATCGGTWAPSLADAAMPGRRDCFGAPDLDGAELVQEFPEVES